MRRSFFNAILCTTVLALSSTAVAEDITVKITLKDHKFIPAELTVPAGKSISIQITNLDATPSEFESKTLRSEKIIIAGGTVNLKIRALSPGRYRFFDDYHEDTTEGFLIVK